MTTTTSPIWLQHPTNPREPLRVDRRADVAIVGGGLVGLLTALMVARTGRTPVIVEADTAGSGTTGRSTGKVTVLQGTKLSRILSRQSRESAQAYVDASVFGRDWLLDYCDAVGLPFQIRRAVTYATTPQGRDAVEREYKAARSLGLPVVPTTVANLPFPTTGAVSLAEQFQVDPAALAGRLAQEVEAAGGTIYESTRVTAVHHHEDGIRIKAGGQVLDADRVVIATNQPMTYRGGFFARCQPGRSFVAALATEWECTEMYISADAPTRSLRSAEVDGREVVLLAGNDYVTGRAISPSAALDELLTWADSNLAVGEPIATWAAQDQTPAGSLPYVGPLTPFDERMLVATGFDKWGLTTSVAAADTLMNYLVPDHRWQRWADTFHPWRGASAATLRRYAELNAPVAVELGLGLARLARTAATQKGREVSMVCPHAGGILRWNDAECSWDCPLHGSRFAPDGSVLNGPAVRGLRRL